MRPPHGRPTGPSEPRRARGPKPLTPEELAALPRALVRELERTARHPIDAMRAMLRHARALEKGNAGDALRSAERAKEAAPRSPEVRAALGTALFRAERWPEAVAELTAYRRLSGDPRYDVWIAEADHRAGKSARALERLERLIAGVADARTMRAAKLLRARIYAETGRPDLARGLLESMRRTTTKQRR